MQTRTHNPFTTIHTEGALLPTDLLQRVLAVDPKLDGLSAGEYHLPAGEKLNEAINRSWNRLQGSWATFRSSRERLGEGDTGTTLTRERWLLPLFQELGFGRLQTSRAIELDGKSYPISHKWGDIPIHLVGCGIELDRRTAGAAGASRSSPHSLLQELLNRMPEMLWGLVSNGLRLRVLRDNASMTRQAFLEFDLESMFEGEVYADFAVLWLVCHQSRMETDNTRPCWLEAWSKAAQEQGTRALDSLRQGVEGAISALGSGFLRHPANQKLRTDLRSGGLSTQEYYRQLLRLVYRLIFLFVAEDRDLLFDPASSPEARGRYLRHYSLARLRRLAERSRGGRHPDLYAALRLVTDILGGRKDSGMGKTGLGLPVLGGFLFAGEALQDLEPAELDNESLLFAIRHLIFMDEGRMRRIVDYKNLGSEELGSIYESLLELHPLVNTDAATFELTAVSGSERKTTGSYYTPSSLIQVLIDSALEPVIGEALKRAGTSAENQQAAILNLKIVDPACGSGHFLVAAAHRLARRLATVRTGEGEPAPEATRSALRSVISNCIYGVDINPMSVELCKVSLWMEALEPGKPLSFLDAHIQCGDSLVGVSPNLDISEIPDEAFNPAFGDNKAISSALKKRNKAERGGQMGLDVFVVRDEEDLRAWMAQKAKNVDALPEETVEHVGKKAQSYQEYLASPQYQHRKLEYDLWTAAFFWKMEAQPGSAGILAPTQEMLRRQRGGGTLPPELVRRVEELAVHLNFLHWELAFPKVFSGENPGFDCVLGNPPWEQIQFDPREFFITSLPEIALAPNASSRTKLIKQLAEENPALYNDYVFGQGLSDRQKQFVHNSNRFPLTSYGRINLAPLFAELGLTLIAKTGMTGLILPTGIATDSYNQAFFNKLIDEKHLVKLYDFDNSESIFMEVDSNFKFCLLTLKSSDELKHSKMDLVFSASSIQELSDERRHQYLIPSDFSLLNPNSRTSPVARTSIDLSLVKEIYSRVPAFVNKNTNSDPWEIRLLLMFYMNTDSGLFHTQVELEKDEYKLTGNKMIKDESVFLPLYEGKMFHLYNHRLANAGLPKGDRGIRGSSEYFDIDALRDVSQFATPRYFVAESIVNSKLHNEREWFLAFRKITGNVANERTVVCSILPKVGLGDSGYAFVPEKQSTKLLSCLCGNLSSLVFDYVAKQKLGGINLSYFVLEQLAVLPPSAYTPADIDFIAPRVLELVYTAYDMRPFAEDMGYHGEPFRWDEVRRAHLRAELDAYYARLYGLTRDELRYILDPKEVHGEDFPGETFRVLKEKEIRLYGEFRTRRLVLEAWDKLEGVEVAAYADDQSPEASEQPAAVKPAVVKETAIAKPASKKQPKTVEENPAQPMMSDFGLYKCQLCGKIVMGYEKEKHTKNTHGGRSVEWKRIK